MVGMTETFTEMHRELGPLTGHPAVFSYVVGEAPMLGGAGVADGNALFAREPFDSASKAAGSDAAGLLRDLATTRVGSARRFADGAVRGLFITAGREVRGTAADFIVAQLFDAARLSTLVLLPSQTAGGDATVEVGLRLVVSRDEAPGPEVGQWCGDVFTRHWGDGVRDV